MKKMMRPKQITLLAIMLAMILLGGAACLLCVRADQTTDVISPAATSELARISQSESISHVFTSRTASLYALTLRVSFPDGVPEEGALVFAIKEEGKSDFFTSRIEVGSIRNNAPLTLSFDEQHGSQQKNYVLTLTSDGIPAATPLALMGGEDESGNGTLFLTTSHIVRTYATTFFILMLLFALCFLPALILSTTPKKGEANE